jgi:hypothetical protein
LIFYYCLYLVKWNLLTQHSPFLFHTPSQIWICLGPSRPGVCTWFMRCSSTVHSQIVLIWTLLPSFQGPLLCWQKAT